MASLVTSKQSSEKESSNSPVSRPEVIKGSEGREAGLEQKVGGCCWAS